MTFRIRYASDLHIEFDRAGTPDYLPSIGEDVVVLAGDIGVGTEGELFRLAAAAIKRDYPAAAQRLIEAVGPQPEADESLRERVLRAVVDRSRLRKRLLRRLNNATASHLHPPDRP